MHERKFVVAYIVVGLLFGGVACAAIAGLFVPVPKVTQTDVKVAVASVAGDQNLVALCESSITDTVVSNGGAIESYTKVSVKHKGNTARVTLTLKSTLYTGKLACDFKKSNWQLGGIVPLA